MVSLSNCKAVAVIALAVGLSCLLVAGCGGSGSDAGCGVEERGERIDLHNSGIECEEASALVNVLPDTKRPQKVGSGKDVWVCTYMPERYQPIKIRCSQDKRFFTLVDTD